MLSLCLRWRTPEVLVEEAVGGTPHRRGEVVLAVGVLDLEVLRGAVKAIDGRGGVQGFVHALPAEVDVAQRGVDE